MYLCIWYFGWIQYEEVYLVFWMLVYICGGVYCKLGWGKETKWGGVFCISDGGVYILYTRMNKKGYNMKRGGINGISAACCCSTLHITLLLKHLLKHNKMHKYIYIANTVCVHYVYMYKYTFVGIEWNQPIKWFLK